MHLSYSHIFIINVVYVYMLRGLFIILLWLILQLSLFKKIGFSDFFFIIVLKFFKIRKENTLPKQVLLEILSIFLGILLYNDINLGLSMVHGFQNLLYPY